MEWTRGEYTITTDKTRVDLGAVHRFLRDESYWSNGVPLSVVERSVEHSLCFSICHGEDFAGYARAVTDRATFAYLCDVFVLRPYRGRGLGKWLIEVISAHPELQGLRRWMLATRDAHGLYEKYGFTPIKDPARLMQRLDPEVYIRAR